MFNLRTQYFQQIEEVYKDIESLKKLCNLSGIKRKISSLFNYSASNDKFNAYINFAVNQLNTIINFFTNEWIKPKLIELYNKLVSLLPSDLQLELPLEVITTEPISKIRKKKITWIQKYFWKQLTLSDIFLLPEIGIGVWENGWRKF